MKKLLFLPILLLLTLFIVSVSGCNGNTKLQVLPSDSIDVYARLKPNEDWISCRHTYGKDSIVGHTIKYRLASDTNNVFVNFDITTLELHPRITTNLLSFIHNEMLTQGFINEGDTIVPFDIKEMTDKGLTQSDIVKKALDWESGLYYNELPYIMEDSMGFELDIEIYPVYLNEDYVTYKKYSYYYTGGAHGNYSSFLQSYNRKTGESVDLEDIIIPEKMDKVREKVALRMAANYPIYSSVATVEQYLDSLNRWKGLTDIGVIMGVTKDEDRERITLKNYPLNDPGVHSAGLVFTYEKYHLTPGCDGCPTILVTFDEIRSCLKEPFCNYYADINEFERYKEWNIYDDPVQWYTEEQLDSVRAAWSPADDGYPWPRDISDWYKYRHGDLKSRYRIDDIIGTWIGYGHLYDPRQILILNANGTFSIVSEEAISEGADGKMRYAYASTIKGNYVYDAQTNRLKFKNWEKIRLEGKTLEAYVKQRDPENKYLIIHSLVRNTMYVADEQGDLWPFYRKR